jgi:hypothetical protein
MEKLPQNFSTIHKNNWSNPKIIFPILNDHYRKHIFNSIDKENRLNTKIRVLMS